MAQALPLTDRISQGSSMKRSYKTKAAEFGNGYSQEAPDGINAIRDEWSLVYENLTNDERATLVAALDAVGGWDYLTWQPFGEASAKKWKVTADGWSASTTGVLWHVSFTVRQVY